MHHGNGNGNGKGLQYARGSSPRRCFPESPRFKTHPRNTRQTLRPLISFSLAAADPSSAIRRQLAARGCGELRPQLGPKRVHGCYCITSTAGGRYSGCILLSPCTVSCTLSSYSVGMDTVAHERARAGL